MCSFSSALSRSFSATLILASRDFSAPDSPSSFSFCNFLSYPCATTFSVFIFNISSFTFCKVSVLCLSESVRLKIYSSCSRIFFLYTLLVFRVADLRLRSKSANLFDFAFTARLSSSNLSNSFFSTFYTKFSELSFERGALA